MRDSQPRIALPELNASLPDLDAVYSEHAGFVWRVLRGMGVHESSLPDAVQDVFIVVHRRYPEFDHRYKVRTWLFEIAYRIARDHRRRHARSAKLFAEQDDDAPSPNDSPAEQALQNENAKLLAKLLDKLDEDKRAVLVLTEIEGLTAPEIAELTGAQVNTVYSRLRRARVEFSQLVAFEERRHK